jgi:predicted DNA-binding WGR domain protein
MRYFEQARADDSGRYWAVRVDDDTLTVREGAFGTEGTEHVERFGSGADAQRNATQQIAQQLRVGFREVVKAQNPRDLQPQQKRPEYRNGLEELILLEEKIIDLIRAQVDAPTREGIDKLLYRYTDVVAADAQLLRAFLKTEGTIESADDVDPELWREIKDEMQSLVPLVITLKNSEASSDPVREALAKLGHVFAARTQRTRARTVPKMYLALTESDLMELGRSVRSRCKSTVASTPAHGVLAARLRA